MRNETEKIVLSGLFIAIGVILPTFFPTPQIAARFLPMHFPILIAGIVLGYKYGFTIGLLTPAVSFMVFQRPPYPMVVAMMLELATYGLVIGLIYKYTRLFKNDIFNIYFALIVAMILGRLIFGSFFALNALFDIEKTYTFSMFIGAVLIISIPGIIIQLLAIPSLIAIIKKYQKRS